MNLEDNDSDSDTSPQDQGDAGSSLGLIISSIGSHND